MNSLTTIKKCIESLQNALTDANKEHLRIEIEYGSAGLIDPRSGEIFVDIENDGEASEVESIIQKKK